MSVSRRRTAHDKSLVGFTLGGVRYAIAIEEVREVVQPTPLTLLPKAPNNVAGVADHRGEVVVVVDLRHHFGLHVSSRPQREKWILLRNSAVALVVDQVTDVMGATPEEVRPAPRVRGEAQRGIRGVLSNDDGLCFLIEVRLFEEISESLRFTLSPPPKSLR